MTQLGKLCGQLPKHHYNTLGFLCHHLNRWESGRFSLTCRLCVIIFLRVAEQAEVNNMPASNLAIGEIS